MRRFAIAWLSACLAVFALAGAARAEVVRLELTERSPYANGRAFEGVGTYEMRRGRVYFAVDPKLEANHRIVDLEFAPHTDKGLVEFSADLEVLCPTDLSKASGSLLYDVNNRGHGTCLGQFNGGADEFLCRQGLIVVWSGWIAETFPGGGRLRLQAPIATDGGRPIRGLVRSVMVTNKEADRLNIAQWGNQGSYPPSKTGLEQATLTWRLREKDPRVPIPHEQWRLEQKKVGADGEHGQLPLVEMVLSGGFQPGYIYELIYEAEGPLVQGAGLAGIRDLVSFLKRDASPLNPLRGSNQQPVVKYALGFGTSQSGRALRMFLHDGFNADEQGRQVFDGVMPHVAGGGLGFFNHRFASPTRHNAQHDNHLFPADMFPFAYDDQKDPFSQETDGILRRARQSGTVPKVMHTQTSSEYWNRSGSLVHTDPLGQQDADIPPEVRIYTFGGCQHGAGSGVPGPRGSGQLPGNPNDYRPLLRGLLVALDAWVREGREPPPSVFPHLADGTLVRWEDFHSGWRPLPGVRYPEVIQQPEFLDRGPDFGLQRIIAIEPPVSKGKYLVRVPAYREDDNERGTLLLPSVAVPLATFTSWNLRHRSIGAENELLSLAGGYIPLPRTAAEAQAAGDPRPSLAVLYQDFDDYRQSYLAVARDLIDRRYALPEELPRFEQAIERHREFFPKR
jgi:hypothetical protein